MADRNRRTNSKSKSPSRTKSNSRTKTLTTSSFTIVDTTRRTGGQQQFRLKEVSEKSRSPKRKRPAKISIGSSLIQSPKKSSIAIDSTGPGPFVKGRTFIPFIASPQGFNTEQVTKRL